MSTGSRDNPRRRNLEEATTLVFHSSLYWDDSPANPLQEDLQCLKPQRTAYTLIIQGYSPGPVKAGMLRATHTYTLTFTLIHYSHAHRPFPSYNVPTLWMAI